MRRTNLWLLIKGYSFTVYRSRKGFIISTVLRRNRYITKGVTLSEAVNQLLFNFFRDFHTYSTFQGTKLGAAMDHFTPTLVQAFEEHGMVIENYGADYKLPSMLPAVDDVAVQDIVEDAIDSVGMSDFYDLGVRTDHLSMSKHVDRIAKGYLINVGEGCDKDYHKDDIADFVLFMNIVDMTHGDGDMWENEVIPPDPVDVARVAVQASSTGYFCDDNCNKKQNSVNVSADLCVQAQGNENSVAFAPAMSIRKLEVIKDYSVKEGVKQYKKGRVIQSVDPALAKATDCIFSSYRLNTGMAGGEIIGESFNGTFGTNLVHRLTGGDHQNLFDNGLHESDASGWEATTKENTAFIALMLALVTAADLSAWGGVAAACMAHYYMPLIALGGHFVGARRGIVCSGSPFTAKYNTLRHRLMVQRFILFSELHNNTVGAVDCLCSFCTHAVAKGFELGHVVTELAADNLRRSVLMGDDFIAIWSDTSPVFDLFRDVFCGTITKTEHKAWDEGEICKRRLFIDCGAFSTRKHPSRVIYKLKGPRGFNATNRMAGAIAHACDSNDDTVYKVMRAVYEALREEYSSNDVDLELSKGFKGTRQMRDFPSRDLVRIMHQPTPRDITKYEIDLQCILKTGRKY